MKLVKTLTAIAIVGLSTSLAFAEGDGAGKPKAAGPRDPRPMMDHLLPPRAVGDLNLTDTQKAKLDELTAAFKKAAEKWHAANPITDADREAMRKAREAGDKAAMGKFAERRKELMETRKGYVDQFRATLTDEQKAKLDKALEEAKNRMGKGPRGEKDEKGEKKGPKPPPAE